MKIAKRNWMLAVFGALAVLCLCFGLIFQSPSVRADENAQETKVTRVHWLNPVNVFCIDFDKVESSEQKTNFESLIGTEGFEAFTDNLLINGKTLPQLNAQYENKLRYDVHLNFEPTCATKKSIYFGINDTTLSGEQQGTSPILKEIFENMTLTFKQGFRRPMADASAPNGWTLETAREIKSEEIYYLTGGANGAFNLLDDTALVLDAASETDVKVGETKTIAVKVPQGLTDVVWSSSDESVATVENGVVSALKEGSATITATSGNRSAKVIVYGVNEYFSGKELKINAGGALWHSGSWLEIPYTNFTFAAIPAGSTFVQIEDKGAHYITDAEACKNFYGKILINGVPYDQWAFDHRAPVNIYLVNRSSIIMNGGGITHGAANYVITFLKGFSPLSSDGTKYFVDETYKLQSSVSVVTRAGDGKTCYQAASTSSLIFDRAPTNMAVGDTGSFHAYPVTNYTSMLLQGQVQYSSSDASVISIDASTGAYTVHKGGAVRIGATYDGVTSYAEYTVPSSAKLDQTSLALGVGNTVTLKATFPENLQISSWTSSDTAIATVENGVVKGVADGTATITVTLSNGDTASCTVNVSTQTVFELICDKDTITMKDELSFTTKTNSASDIEWTITEGGALATLAKAKGSTNVLTPLGYGTVTVQAKLKDEPDFFETVTITILSTVELNVSSEKTAVGGTVQLTAVIMPAEAEVQYSTSDDTVATVDSEGKVTALKKGTATITAAAPDGQKATCKITVFEDVTTSVDKYFAPSPDKNIFQLQLTVSPYDLELKNQNGWLNLEKIAASDNEIPAALADFFAKIKINGKTFVEFWADGDRDYDVNLHLGQLENLLNFNTYSRGSQGGTAYVIPDGFTIIFEEGIRFPEKINGEWRGSEYVLDKTYMYELNNYVPSPATVKGVMLNESASLKTGESKTLAYQINGNEYAASYLELSWASSDPAVATIEDGVLKGIKEGTATITVTLGIYTATCSVTVTAEGGGTVTPPDDHDAGCGGAANVAGMVSAAAAMLVLAGVLVVRRKKN